MLAYSTIWDYLDYVQAVVLYIPENILNFILYLCLVTKGKSSCHEHRFIHKNLMFARTWFAFICFVVFLCLFWSSSVKVCKYAQKILHVCCFTTGFDNKFHLSSYILTTHFWSLHSKHLPQEGKQKLGYLMHFCINELKRFSFAMGGKIPHLPRKWPLLTTAH